MVKVYRIGFSPLGHEGGPTKKDDPYKINIIFVHGLRGHPKNTWGRGSNDMEEEEGAKGEGTSPKSILRREPKKKLPKPFWPYEFLREDIPEARIWTYGYNAEVMKGWFNANNKLSISQHGQDLATRFERECDNDDPVIFVAHSLGGILVKDAICRSEQARERTKFAVFLGTPHRGSRLAKSGSVLSKLAALALQDANHTLVSGLDLNNGVLDTLLRGFNDIVCEDGIKVHSFQEGRGVRGRRQKVVDDFSSKLDLPSALETVETIDADHSQMIKFADREDAGYRAVSGTLRKFIRAYFQEDNSTPEAIAAAATAVPAVPPEIPDTSHDEPDTPQASEPPPAGAQKVEEAITLLKRRTTTFRFPDDRRLTRRATVLGGGNNAVRELGYFVSRCLTADGRAGEAAELLEHIMSERDSSSFSRDHVGRLAPRQTFPRFREPVMSTRRQSIC